MVSRVAASFETHHSDIEAATGKNEFALRQRHGIALQVEETPSAAPELPAAETKSTPLRVARARVNNSLGLTAW
jgi:hypothetical protein